MAAPQVFNEDMYVNTARNAQQPPQQQQAPPGNSRPWLHGALSRGDVDRLMKESGYADGLFLIRESTKSAGNFVLSVVAYGKLEHYIITTVAGQFRIDDGPVFTNLNDLVHHYMYKDDRLPTRLRDYVPNQVQAFEQDNYEPVWDDQPMSAQMKSMSLGGSGGRPQMPPPSASQRQGQAPAPVLSDVGGTPYASSDMFDKDGSLKRGASLNSGGDDLAQIDMTPVQPAGHFSTMGGSSGMSGMSASSWGSQPSAAMKSQTLPVNRDKNQFKQLKRVKQWIDRGEEIASVNLEVKDELMDKKVEGFSSEASERAHRHLQQFSEAALAEEKMYLAWMNKKLSTVNKSIDNLNDDLRDGTKVMEVLKMIGHLPAPFYAKKPTVIQQEIDNWHVVKKYMRKLGMVVDHEEKTDAPPAPGEGVGLDPVELHKGDRREILKLFSKLLLYETMHPKK